MAVQPIKPSQVAAKKQQAFPDAVLDSFNELIVKNYCNGSATFTQNAVVALIAGRADVPRHQVFDNQWLDIEAIYEAAGWKVLYDKPAYNEDYEATFTFRKRQ